MFKKTKKILLRLGSFKKRNGLNPRFFRRFSSSQLSFFKLVLICNIARLKNSPIRLRKLLKLWCAFLKCSFWTCFNFFLFLDDEKNKMLPEGSLDQDGSQAKKHPRNFTYLYFVISNLRTSVYFVFYFLFKTKKYWHGLVFCARIYELYI